MTIWTPTTSTYTYSISIIDMFAISYVIISINMFSQYIPYSNTESNSNKNLTPLQLLDPAKNLFKMYSFVYIEPQSIVNCERWNNKNNTNLHIHHFSEPYKI